VVLEIVQFSRVLGSDPKLGTCEILPLEGLCPFGTVPLLCDFLCPSGISDDGCGRCNLRIVSLDP
jgi:hypothetical protein